MIELLSRKVGYPIEHDFSDGQGSQDLLTFGKELQDGKAHLGVMWGTEFGLLKSRYNELEPLVMCLLGTDLFNAAQLMVRKNGDAPVPNLDDLKGRTLVSMRRTPITNRLYLDKLKLEKGNAFFQFEAKPRSTSKEAILAIRNDESDQLVLLIDLYAFVRFGRTHPKITGDLVMIERSSYFPAPTIVGNPRVVRKLNAELWSRLTKELTGIHNSAEGRQLVSFWRFDSFRAPDSKFRELAKSTAEAYQQFLTED